MPTDERGPSALESTPVLNRTLIFRLANEHFGLPLNSVREVLEVSQAPTPIVGAPDWIAGMINHHGQVHLVLKAGRLFDVDSQADVSQVLLVQLQGERMALAVDQIEAIEELQTKASVPGGVQRFWHQGVLLTMFTAKDLAAAIERVMQAEVSAGFCW